MITPLLFFKFTMVSIHSQEEKIDVLGNFYWSEFYFFNHKWWKIWFLTWKRRGRLIHKFDLYTSKCVGTQVTHQVRVYLGCFSMKWQGVFLIPPSRDACPLQGYPSFKFAGTHLYVWVKRGIVSQSMVSAIRTQCSASARAWTQTVQSRVQDNTM